METEGMSHGTGQGNSIPGRGDSCCRALRRRPGAGAGPPFHSTPCRGASLQGPLRERCKELWKWLSPRLLGHPLGQTSGSQISGSQGLCGCNGRSHRLKFSCSIVLFPPPLSAFCLESQTHLSPIIDPCY